MVESVGERGRCTIFWPPGPEPLRKASSISDSLITGRGGSCLAAKIALLFKSLRGHNGGLLRSWESARKVCWKDIVGAWLRIESTMKSSGSWVAASNVKTLMLDIAETVRDDEITLSCLHQLFCEM